jgi:hypothetical protein
MIFLEKDTEHKNYSVLNYSVKCSSEVGRKIIINRISCV